MNEITMQNEQMSAIEQVVIQGDLSRLTPDQRVTYYNQVCESLGLNPYTKPFEYIRLNGKLQLYPKKDCTEQLRRLHGISLSRPEIQQMDGIVTVTVSATNSKGRTDSDIGVVSTHNLRGNDLANAIMKAVTKAKRRATLSIAGLGWNDETEMLDVPGATVVSVDDEGKMIESLAGVPQGDFDPAPQWTPATDEQKAAIGAMGKWLYENWSREIAKQLANEYQIDGHFTDESAARLITDFENAVRQQFDGKMHALGNALAGKDWDNIRASYVENATEGRTTSSGNLTGAEFARLLDAMMEDAMMDDGLQHLPDGANIDSVIAALKNKNLTRAEAEGHFE